MDDGIVVGMSGLDFDWDRFEAEGEEIARRMHEVSRTMAEQNAASRAERARDEERRARAGSTARETPPDEPASIEARLDRVEAIVTEIRDRMATKVELEAMRDSVQMIADGYAQTQHRLADTSGLLKRYLTG